MRILNIPENQGQLADTFESLAIPTSEKTGDLEENMEEVILLEPGTGVVVWSPMRSRDYLHGAIGWVILLVFLTFYCTPFRSYIYFDSGPAAVAAGHLDRDGMVPARQ